MTAIDKAPALAFVLESAGTSSGRYEMDQDAYYRSHPPRCISAYAVEVVPESPVALDGHPSQSQLSEDTSGVKVIASENLNPVFALACKCGGSEFLLKGFDWKNPDFGDQTVFLSPLTLECTSCGQASDFFDSDVHGYDAELDHGSSTIRSAGEPTLRVCEQCDHESLRIAARFEYPDDLFDEDFPEAKDRQQELFTWFSAIATCPKCNHVFTAADFECA